ncbi:MAG: Rab family GTPase [Promethearchaeota archaeon]
MINRNKLFSNLFGSFLEKFIDVEALIVSDFEGLIIAGDRREGINIELVSVLTTLVNPILSRIRDEYSFRQFGTGSFDTNEYRLLFISIDRERILSLILKSMASIDKIAPYAYFLAEKTAQILNAEDGDSIQLTIPDFDEEVRRHNILQDQICQIEDSSEKGNYTFKFIIVGDHEVGKTSLIRQYVEKKFLTDYRATIGLNVLAHSFEFQGNSLNLTLWDVGAQIFFKRFRKIYYSGAETAFIVYDLTKRSTFENIKTWYQELTEFIERDIPVILVGNKLDLKEQRVVSREEGLELANNLSPDGVSYIETSAKSGENVGDAFKLIAYHYMLRTKQKEKNFINQQITDEINKTLSTLIILEISFITENMTWSPGFQVISELDQLGECSKIKDNDSERLYVYNNGLIINNFLYDNFNLANSDAVFVIFDAREKEHVEPAWRDILLKIMQKIRRKRVIVVGIRVSNDNQWMRLLEEFHIEGDLEEKLISVLFLKIGEDYRTQIYDNLKLMLTAIINTKAVK